MTKHIPFIFAIMVLVGLFAFCAVKLPGANQVRQAVTSDMLSAGPGANTVGMASLRVYGWMGEGIEVGEVGTGPYLSLPSGVELNVLGL